MYRTMYVLSYVLCLMHMCQALLEEFLSLSIFNIFIAAIWLYGAMTWRECVEIEKIIEGLNNNE